MSESQASFQLSPYVQNSGTGPNGSSWLQAAAQACKSCHCRSTDPQAQIYAPPPQGEPPLPLLLFLAQRKPPAKSRTYQKRADDARKGLQIKNEKLELFPFLKQVGQGKQPTAARRSLLSPSEARR